MSLLKPKDKKNEPVETNEKEITITSSEEKNSFKNLVSGFFFEKDENGRKKMTTAGKSGIVIFVIVMILGLTSFIMSGKSTTPTAEYAYKQQDKGNDYITLMANKTAKELDEEEAAKKAKAEEEKNNQNKQPVIYSTQQQQPQPQVQTYQPVNTPQPQAPLKSALPQDFEVNNKDLRDMQKEAEAAKNPQSITPAPSAYIQPSQSYTSPQQKAQTIDNNFHPGARFLNVGSSFPAILKNNITTGQPVLTALCQIDSPILTDDGQVVIPAGSLFEGQAQFTRNRVNINFTKITFPNGTEKSFLAYAADTDGNIGLAANDTNFISRTSTTVVAAVGSAYLSFLGQATPASTIYNGNQVIQTQTSPSFTNIVGQKLSNVADQQINQQAQANQAIYELPADTKIYIKLSQKFVN